MRIDHPSDYRHVGFRVSFTKFKKYDAILENKQTGKLKYIPFGDTFSKHFKDITGLGYYTYLNHNDPKRRTAFRKRFYEKARFLYSSAYFAYHYLW